MKKFFFLSGLPRSGSTLLTAILNQNPEIYSSPTSGLIDLMGSTLSSWYNKVNEVQGRNNEELFRLLYGVMNSKYEKIDKPIIIDKSRGWTNPDIMRTMSQVLGEPMKIIATVRNVPDCAASFVRVVNPQDKKKFIMESALFSHLKNSYMTLYNGFITYPDSILFVDYDDLISDPKKQLQKIHEFLGLTNFDYDFENIDGSIVSERDEEVWDIPNLHKITPKIGKQHNQDSQEVLGSFYDEFIQNIFWDESKNTKQKNNILDKQLDLSLKGRFDEAYEIVKQLEKNNPENDRAAFNRGWFVLSKGKLSEGHKLLDRGRNISVFGNAKPNTDKPIWDGFSKGTVLLYLEGGLGDQILAVRYSKDIVDRGCKVILSCSKSLVELFKDIEHVSAVLEHGHVYAVYHDYWIPSMSSVISLGYEYEDLNGNPYIKKTNIKEKNNKFRIGLRWEGNPEFEHEQYRKFPTHLLFDAIKDFDVEFVSLQRDTGLDKKPDWVKEVKLDTWCDTQNEISKCDLVISSCTSVGHLSAAMGVPTWIVVPILPYYIWSLPGNTTPYYNSVKLFRQEIYGNWAEPFSEINKELHKIIKKDELVEYLSV